MDLSSHPPLTYGRDYRLRSCDLWVMGPEVKGGGEKGPKVSGPLRKKEGVLGR